MTEQRRAEVSEGAVPQAKAMVPEETKGAKPTTSVPKPAHPPKGPSGISPSKDGSR